MINDVAGTHWLVLSRGAICCARRPGVPFHGEIWLRPSAEEEFAAVTTQLDPLKGPAPVPEEAKNRLFSGGAILALTWRSQSSPPVYSILELPPAMNTHPCAATSASLLPVTPFLKMEETAFIVQGGKEIQLGWGKQDGCVQR